MTGSIQSTSPRIAGKHVSLEPFSEEFVTDRYVSWLNDPEVVRHSRQRFSEHTRETSLNYLELMNKIDVRFWAVLESKTDIHIGNISATIDRPNSAADIAIMIGERNVWGRGYGLEVWTTVMKHLHKEGIRLVTGGCMATNKAMIKVMEKSGMKPYYIRAGYFLDQGKPVDSVHYASFL